MSNLAEKWILNEEETKINLFNISQGDFSVKTTYLGDEKPKSIQVAQSFSAHSKLSDSLVEFISSIIRVFLICICMILSEEPPVLQHASMIFVCHVLALQVNIIL